MRRRTFIQSLAAAPSLLTAAKQPDSAPYTVGSSHTTDPYTGAAAAIAACGQFPSDLTGRPVVIKPNLVNPYPSTSGDTTDPQIVRAIVDRALAAGASNILIIEAAQLGLPSNFDACGYTAVFASYPQVQLLDMRANPYTLTPVPGGYAHQSIWISSLALTPGAFFVSAAKLKTHQNAFVTLSMKCLVGLASDSAAVAPGRKKPLRLDLHHRSIEMSIVDLNLARPVDFAVIDGIWGKEGQGTGHLQAVPANTVLAGANAIAVDRVALDLMQVSQTAVPYLTYAAQAGLGPAGTSSVTVLGDPLQPYPFIPARTAPIAWQPAASPSTISIAAGQSTTISYQISASCFTLAEIIRDSDATPAVKEVRILHRFQHVAAPGESVVWDGKDDSGNPVKPGLYLARVQAHYTKNSQPVASTVGRITVTA